MLSLLSVLIINIYLENFLKVLRNLRYFKEVLFRVVYLKIKKSAVNEPIDDVFNSIRSQLFIDMNIAIFLISAIKAMHSEKDP